MTWRAFKQLSTEEHDLDEAGKALIRRGKNVGNCKCLALGLLIGKPAQREQLPRATTPSLSGLGLTAPARAPRPLILQLRSFLQMCTSCSGLVGASPERPSDDVGRLDASLREADGNAAEFLDRPADEVWCLRASRIGIFGGVGAFV